MTPTTKPRHPKKNERKEERNKNPESAQPAPTSTRSSALPCTIFIPTPHLQGGLCTGTRRYLLDVVPSYIAACVFTTLLSLPKEKDACVDMFFKRHSTDLTEEIDLAGGTYKGFLKMFGKTIKTTASNERSLQNTGVRLLFLSKYNKEFQFMENTLPGEATVQNKAVINAKVLSTLEEDKNDHETNLATLRSALYSDTFYKNGELYHRWCEGFESLQLRGCKIPGPRPITELLTLAHETHFRLEIYMAMSRTSFVHTPGTAAALHRRLLFKKLLPLVREDRKVRPSYLHVSSYLCCVHHIDMSLHNRTMQLPPMNNAWKLWSQMASNRRTMKRPPPSLTWSWMMQTSNDRLAASLYIFRTVRAHYCTRMCHYCTSVYLFCTFVCKNVQKCALYDDINNHNVHLWHIMSLFEIQYYIIITL